ncbi:MAG TPA: DUF1223 domain-containing protein [Devosiaceae bacterium]|nr:DUF1223 domain-containing protein [Devosiaceae bacterium]
MKVQGLISILLLLSAVAPADASEIKSNPKAVLELFTSQGCSSCPPADALLKTLQQRPDIIALAYHVDYWDYIGWTDTFGSKANTERQRAYAESWDSNNIYTPELVVNGAKDVVGSRKAEVESTVQQASLPVPVSLKTDKDMLDVTIGGMPGAAESGVWLVTFIDKASVDVERGENAGQKLEYTEVVTGRHILGMWDPQNGAHLRLPLDEVLSGPSDGAAILVQRETRGLPGPIMGAASFVR